MNRRAKSLVLCVIGCLLSACAGTLPEPRLTAYVPPSAIQPGLLSTRSTPLDVALVIMNDAAGKDSAPPLSDEELRPVPELFRTRLEHELPVKVLKEALVRAMPDRAGAISWKQIAEEQGVETILIAILSHVEKRSQDSLLLDGSHEGGGAMGTVLGTVTSDFALVELALLDTKANRVLVRAEGRGWATLEEIDSGLASNVYPAIRKAGRTQRYFPPREDPAKRATLRWVAEEDALSQAVAHLREGWGR